MCPRVQADTEGGTGDARRRFLDARRRSGRERYDTRYAPTYDRDWGEISPSHRRFVERTLSSSRERGLVLDIPCGTGKYWPLVLASGRSVVGFDQSAGMLSAARTKHPQVPAAIVGLQELDLDACVDAILCIDGIENVGPEDWPTVLAGLRRAARETAPLYLTVEVDTEGEATGAYRSARAAGHPVVKGEVFDGVGYHYYPERADIDAWLLDAGLRTVDEAEADGYLHLLLRPA